MKQHFPPTYKTNLKINTLDYAKPPSKPDTLTIRSPLTRKNTKIALPFLKNSGALNN